MENSLLFNNLIRDKSLIGLIHRVYLTYLQNKRKYNANTKTKSEVRGGGRKPWRQKGTGNARAGSIRSPLWVGGGVSFGPKSRNIFKKVNKKEKRLAVFSSLFLKKANIISVEQELFDNFNTIKTQNFIKLIESLKINPAEKILIILPFPNKFLLLSSQNLKNIEITLANSLNIEQILKNKHIIASNSSFKIINSLYGKK